MYVTMQDAGLGIDWGGALTTVLDIGAKTAATKQQSDLLKKQAALTAQQTALTRAQQETAMTTAALREKPFLTPTTIAIIGVSIAAVGAAFYFLRPKKRRRR